ncbi:MAG: hypothetical protein ACLP5H_11160 [Desulfomonilaceae bacterium]
MGKATISAKQVLVDIRAGATDEFLMKKYGVSENGLQSLFQKLVTAKVITQDALNNRASAIEEVEAVIIEEDEAKPLPPKPTCTKTVFKCPACHMTQNHEFEVCPQCEVIVEKFLQRRHEKEIRQSQIDEQRVESTTL